MKLFYDSEFTGLHQVTTLISIALIDEQNNYFYAEFNDYDFSQIDGWLKDNVLANLEYNKDQIHKKEKSLSMRGNTETIKAELLKWLANYSYVEIWSDCLSYDWVLFNNIFGHAFKLPINIYYIPFDICTLFKIKNIDPDIDREKFIDLSNSENTIFDQQDVNKQDVNKHNALHDARTIKKCYEKLLSM